jgi:hypothetical protein
MSTVQMKCTLALFCLMAIPALFLCDTVFAAKTTGSDELLHGVSKIQIPRPNEDRTVSTSAAVTTLEQEFDQGDFQSDQETAQATDQALEEFGSELE